VRWDQRSNRNSQKGEDEDMNTMKATRPLRLALVAPLAAVALSVAPHAWADSILVQQSTMVNGSESTTDSFTTGSAGTVTVTLTDTGWNAPLSALSFSANSATGVLASFNAVGLTSDTAQFVVNGAGTYFASIMATAGGAMDLGLYSLKMTFSPNMPSVPLPSTGWLFLTGLFALVGIARAVRPFESMGTAEA
jgi:hypothetical protein